MRTEKGAGMGIKLALKLGGSRLPTCQKLPKCSLAGPVGLPGGLPREKFSLQLSFEKSLGRWRKRNN